MRRSRIRPFVFALLLAALVVVAFRAGQANAWSRDPGLSNVASVFAMRPVSVRCYSDDEPGSPNDYGAWGYVKKPIGRAKYAGLVESLCLAAKNVNSEAYSPERRALGVLVLVHESYHLRRWGGAGDEGKVECQAIRHWKYGARFLGASDLTIKRLFPVALALHAEETRIVDIWTGTRPYEYDACNVPGMEIPDEDVAPVAAGTEVEDAGARYARVEPVKAKPPAKPPNWEEIASFYAGRPVKISEDTRGPLQATTGMAESGEIRLGKQLRSGLDDWFNLWTSQPKQRKNLIALGVNPLAILLHESMHNRHFDESAGFKDAWDEHQAAALGAELIPDLLHRFFGVPIDSPLSRAYAKAAKQRAEYQQAYGR